ncbi:hypothetical protein GQX73_g1500 [Xylaria multiplex]|uniref:NmrA-like domain-containing protein n=1 Tax=Xylaria multiplex TaxID=323545 RepID=A0A7C8IWI7_9PEZI|nr:hypothetical protein GQX73_g1500 [Xylaria multiplex]
MVTYLVTQATGHQSQWTIKHLLAAGQKVHAIVRDPAKIPEVLERPGVTVFKGESVNFDDVFRAAQGCEAVYLNTFPIPGLEAQQAKTIVEASKKAGLKSVVASTTMSTGYKDMWDDDVTKECHLHDYFLSKAAVEDIVRGAGFEAWTILRPGVIHFDYFLPSCAYNFPRLATHGELDHFFNDGVRMPQTDANDVGIYAAAALQDPAKFGGQEIELSSENLTIEEVRDILAKVSGRNVRTRRHTSEDTPIPGQLFQLWVNSKDLTRVVAAAQEAQAKFGIPFTPLEEAFKREKSRLLETLAVLA